MGFATSFDFAVLGDVQPEGLLTATALARKGYSVTVVPSQSLGELGPEENWPLLLPERIYNRRLNDLLFKAGFFRLEDSGLSPSPAFSQFVLPKHRLLFDGTHSTWEREVEREYPSVSASLRRVLEWARRPQNKFLGRAAQELADIQKKDIHVRAWFKAEIDFHLRPHVGHDVEDVDLFKHWLQSVQKEGSKVYRVDPKLRQPYHQFLADHARRWGVQFMTPGEFTDLKSSWSHYSLSEAISARNLILNSMGAARALSKSAHPSLFQERMRHWLYLDTITCSIQQIPEPLQEFCYLDFADSASELPSQRYLYTHRNPLRGTATLTVGSWLPFDENRIWVSQIERGRDSLKKLMPFLPASDFKSIPSALELTELRGDCFKRGAFDRLMPYTSSRSRFSKAVDRMTKWIPNKSPVFRMKKRLFPVMPHYLPFRNRVSSIEACLHLLEHFDRKSKRKFSISES